MNVTATQAGIISALMVTVLVLGVVMIAGRGGKKNSQPVGIASIPITMFFCVLFFTFIGWFPIWTGSVIALVLVIFVGFVFGKIFGVS